MARIERRVWLPLERGAADKAMSGRNTEASQGRRARDTLKEAERVVLVALLLTPLSDDKRSSTKVMARHARPEVVDDLDAAHVSGRADSARRREWRDLVLEASVVKEKRRVQPDVHGGAQLMPEVRLGDPDVRHVPRKVAEDDLKVKRRRDHLSKNSSVRI